MTMKVTVFDGSSSAMKDCFIVEDHKIGPDSCFTAKEAKQIYDALHAHFGPQTYEDVKKLYVKSLVAEASKVVTDHKGRPMTYWGGYEQT